MRHRSQLLLLAWPGLPHLWLRGAWAGLVLAVGFTVLVCVLLAGVLVWTGWIAPAVQYVGSFLAAAIWVGSVVVSSRGDLWADQSESENSRTQSTPVSNEQIALPPQRDLFSHAQGQYLRGDWLAAEQTLRRLLSGNRRDVEARLLLATICRRMNRPEEANVQLAMLDRLETAERWGFEITAERRYLGEICGTDGSREPSEHEPITLPFPHEANNRTPNEQKTTATGQVYASAASTHAETTGKIDAA